MTSFVFHIEKLGMISSNMKWACIDPDQPTTEWTATLNAHHKLDEANYIWDIMVSSKSSNLKADISPNIMSVSLVQTCDDQGGLSADVNGKLQKLLHDGEKWFKFAANINSFVNIRIVREFESVATRL